VKLDGMPRVSVDAVNCRHKTNQMRLVRRHTDIDDFVRDVDDVPRDVDNVPRVGVTPEHTGITNDILFT